jgi:hypothetical protein
MNEPFDDQPLLDSIDDIPREAFDSIAAPDELRNRTWHATAHLLRRRRLVQRAARCAGAAALFLCGIAVGVWATRGGHAPSSPTPPKPIDSTVAKQNDDPDEILRDAEAFALRLKSAPKSEQIALLRRAGDRYLNEEGDITLAMRCYRRMLDIAETEGTPSVDINDSWLLMALKFDRQRETSNDQPNA